MFIGNQRHPTIQELQQTLNSLQHQLVMSNGNYELQQQIQQQMNNVKYALTQAQQANQQANYQANYHHPVMGGVNNMGNGMSNGMGVSQPRVHPTQFGAPENLEYPTGEVSRYDKRVVPTTELNVKPEAVAPTVDDTIELKPLNGNEFPLLLADGLRAEKEALGKYFKYKITGEYDMNGYSDRITKVEKVTSNDLNMENKLTFSNNAIVSKLSVIAEEKDTMNVTVDITTAIDITAPKSIRNTYYIDLIRNSKDLVELANKLKILAEEVYSDTNETPRSTRLYDKIDTLLTRRVVEAAKMISNIGVYIECFTDDIEDLVNSYIPNNMDTESQVKYRKILDQVMLNLKNDVEDKNDLCESVIETDNYHTIRYFEDITVFYTNLIVFRGKIMSTVTYDTPLAITEVGYPEIYKIFKTIFSDPNNICSKTNKAVLCIDATNSDKAEFVIYRNINNDYTIARYI